MDWRRSFYLVSPECSIPAAERLQAAVCVTLSLYLQAAAAPLLHFLPCSDSDIEGSLHQPKSEDRYFEQFVFVEHLH